jgi:hypothetical protein
MSETLLLTTDGAVNLALGLLHPHTLFILWPGHSDHLMDTHTSVLWHDRALTLAW